MPRLYEDVDICGRSAMGCINDVTKQIQSQINKSFVCECLPSCHSINYETELSMAPIIEESPLMKTNSMQVKDTSILHIFFREGFFRSQKRDEIIGFTEFLC